MIHTDEYGIQWTERADGTFYTEDEGADPETGIRMMYVVGLDRLIGAAETDAALSTGSEEAPRG